MAKEAVKYYGETFKDFALPLGIPALIYASATNDWRGALTGLVGATVLIALFRALFKRST